MSQALHITRRVFAASFAAAAIAGCGGSGSSGASAADATDRTMGSPDAPITFIEYAATTCNHCAAFHQITFPTLKERYIDTGQVFYIFREFPLNSLDAAAYLVAGCADESRYFDVLDVLFQTQATWIASTDPRGELLKIARSAGISESEFDACIRDEEGLARIRDGVERGQREHDVRSTPTLIINGAKYEGGRSIEQLEAIFEPYLGGS